MAASVTKKSHPAAKSKSKSDKVLKAKKPSGPNKPRTHPPYVEMIKEAIVSLKERTGSSQYAIAKFTEEKQSDLPPNFKKLLLVQLKKLVASGQLTKVKNSFKLAPVVANSTTAAAPKKIPAKKKAAAKPKSGATVKPKGTTPVKAKKVVAKPKKVAKTATVTSPGKKKAVKAVVAKPKKTPAKAVKKPKSIKSPVKRGKK